MNRNAIINKGISVLLISTFITTQAFALSPSLVSDPGINQARSVTVQEEVAGKTKPGAIGNGQALVELFHGNLPPRIDINDEITAQLQDAIKLAVHLNRDKGNLVPAQHEEKVRLAANNLFGLYSNLTNRTYLYSAIARDSEDYLIGFNHYMAGGESSRIGLAIDFINWLYSKYPPETAKLRLAQYIYHECVPENLVAKEGMIVDTTDHKDIYKEVQTKIFGEEEVAALGRDLREFIEAKVKGPVRLAEAQNLPDLLRGIKESVRATEGSITITDQARFRKDTVDYLAFTAALSQNPDARTSAQQLLREVAPRFNLKPASIHDFYMAKIDGTWANITVPAVNGRADVYHQLSQLFRAAKEKNVGALILELARSETRYSEQDVAEFTAICIAAAIKAGYEGLLFMQGDHYQVNKAKYNDEKTREQELQAIEQIARKALLAGKYNIDLDASTLVDNAALDQILEFQKNYLDRYLKANSHLLKGLDDNGVKALRRQLVDEIEMGDIKKSLSGEERAQIEGLYQKMHKTNAEVNMRFIRYIRKLEKELGLTKSISIGIEERHVDDPKHKNNPSTVLGSMTLAQTILKMCKDEGLVGPSKMSLQTGTMHGVGGTVDFGIYKRHLKYAKQIGIAVFVQHGASTLEKKDFDKMKDGDVGEVHLATEYQKIELGIVSHELPDLGERMATYLEGLIYNNPKAYGKFLPIWDLAFGNARTIIDTINPDDPNRAELIASYNKLAIDQRKKSRRDIITEILGDSMPKGLKGKLKDLVKELPGPFKRELMNLPQRVRNIVDKALYEEFSTILEKLGASNTKELIEKIIPFAGYPVITPPRSQALQNAVRLSNAVVAEAQNLNDLLKGIRESVRATEGSITITDQARFRKDTVDYLAFTAALSQNPDARTSAQQLLREVAPRFNLKPASIHDFYMAKIDGTWANITVPAVNGRADVYHQLSQLFRAAKEKNVGALILELARSETRYSEQDVAEFTAICIAAAIKAGYEGLLFMQGDHYQVNKAKYNDEKTREQELQAIEQIARKALLAGKYNIDLDASTLVDNAALDKILAFQKAFLDRYLRANPDLLKGFDENGVKALRRELVDKIEMKEIEFLTEAQHAEIRGLYNEMHKTNAEVNMRFIKYIRNLEKELGITRPVSIGIEERHVDDPKHKNNPSTVLGSMTLAQTILEACKEAGIVGPSKMSLQTGTMHGVGGTVDFGIYKRHLKYAKQIGIAVFVQHGASTLEKKDFDKMKDGDVGEVHLATEYQKIELGIVSHELPDLGERMATYLEGLMRDNPKSYAKFLPMWELAFGRRTLALGTIEPDDPDRETKNKLYNELAATQYEKTREEIITEILGDSMPKGLKGKLKDLVKELPGPFKRELMNLPQRVRNIVDKALYEEFSTILEKLGASNTKELIEKIIPFAGYPVITPPRSQALQNAVERSAVGPLEAQSVDELLNRIDNTTQVTKDSVVVTNHGRFVERTVDYLALTAGLSGDSDTRAAAQTLLDELAASFNFKFGSSSDLNMFAGEGKEKNLYYATIIPVFNGTTAMYDKLRDSFKAVKESQKEAIMLELAMSKTRASREELSIFTASIIAAAIREGYEGLIFVQGDHYQVSGEGLVERELRGVAGPLRQAILDAGGASIDIDTGIYPKLLKAGDKDAIETVLGVKDNVVDQYLNRHPELVKDLSGEGVKLLRLGLAVQLGFGHDAIADTTQPVRSYAQIMASDGKGEHFATGYRQEVAPGKKRPVALQKAIAQRDFGISEDISDATKEVEFLTTGAVATSTTKLTSAPDLSKIVVIMKTDLPMAVTVGAEEEYSNTLLQEYHKMKQELKKHFANGVIEVTTKEELEREMALLIGSGFKVIVLDDGTLTKDVKDGDIQGKAGENYCVVTTDAVKNSDPLMVPFINLNAMAMMGVGVLNKDVTLFEIAYKIFTGNEAPKEIVDSLTKQALWIIKVLPRIIKLTGAIYDHKKIRELFLAAA